jgi:hypothetical protein
MILRIVSHWWKDWYKRSAIATRFLRLAPMSTPAVPAVQFVVAEFPLALAQERVLLTECAATLGHGLSVQGLAQELAGLAGP